MADMNMGEALSWDGSFTDEDREFTTIPEGAYRFEVKSVERGQFAGSARMAACPEAIVAITLDVDGQTRQLTERLKLNTKLKWIIKDFFRSIKMADETSQEVRMDWMGAVGRSGWCFINVEEYNGKEYNHVQTWYAPSEVAAKNLESQQAQAPAAPAATGYTWA